MDRIHDLNNDVEYSKASSNDQSGDASSLAQLQPPPFQLKSTGRDEADKEQGLGEKTSQLQTSYGEAPSQPNDNNETPPNNTGLPNQLKNGVENLSGFSLDDVNVHYNSEKPAQLQAHAYAQGTEIHLASGQEKHLPHEAWHVVQQKQGRVQPTAQLKAFNINNDVGLEKEADEMGAKAMQVESKKPHLSGNIENYSLQRIELNNTVQRKLEYYNKDGEKKTFNNFADVFAELTKIVHSKDATKDMNNKESIVIGYVNKKLASKKIKFNIKLVNYFININNAYLSGKNPLDFMDSLSDFYSKSIDSMTKEAGVTSKTKTYTDLLKLYTAGEGDDGFSVGTDYDRGLACTLFSLIAVKGNIFGASTPEELHNILQSIPEYNDYDEDKKVGLIRLQAGLTYSKTYSGKTVNQMISSLKDKDKDRKFIIDMKGEAHTFALIYQGSAWKRFDNGSNNGYKQGSPIGVTWGGKEIIVTWE